MSNSSINIQTTEFKGNNLTGGTGIYDSVNPFNQLNFKSLVGAGAISVVSGASNVIISASTASGEANTGTNVGTGAQVFKDKLGTALRFKTLLAAGSVGITTVGDEIFISAGTEALGAGSITEIQYNNSTGNTLGANSGFTFIEATQSFTLGNRGTCAEGKYSSTQGSSNDAFGNYSHAGGQSSIAGGYASFSQGKTNSALGCHSAILGGQNNNIAIGNTNAVILGGNNIDLTGTSYIDTTAVDNLAIISTPSVGATDDNVLVWESGSTGHGIVKKVTQASVSDERLKTIIQPIQKSLEGIIALNGYEYEFNDKMQPKSMVGKKKYGLLAQEVEEKFPLVVNNNLQFDDALYKTVEYRELVPVLVEAIKELEERIRILENK